MKKIITRIVVIMFAFCLPFLFCACDSTLNFTPKSTTVKQSTGGRAHGTAGSIWENAEIPNPEFYMEDDKYVYFSELWESINGVRLASSPGSVNSGGDDVSALTK